MADEPLKDPIDLTPTAPTEAAAEPTAPTTEAEASKGKGKKKKVFVLNGYAHIQATYNNTIVSITDVSGNVIAWSSAGKMGFKGPKKATPYAAGIIVRDVVDRAKLMGLKSVDVFVRGVGLGRESAVRALAANGLNLTQIKDITPVPHNGPRPRKVRRV